MKDPKRSVSRHVRASLLAAAALCLATGRAEATNGYWPYGFGTASKGIAGAGVALALDSLAAASNPAAMVRVGSRTDIAVSFLYPPRGYTIGEGGLFVPHSQDSNDNFFIGPSFGLNRMVGERTSLGVAVYGAGLNTNYPASAGGFGTFLTGKTGVDVRQLFVAPTLAYAANDAFSVGVAPILAIQLGQANGFAAFAPFSNDPAALTNNATDVVYGGGVRLGAQLDLGQLTLGVSYQTRVYMSDFEDYAGLLPEGGNFSAPANAAVGLAYHFDERSFITAEVQQILYSEVPVLGNSINNLFSGCAAAGGTGSDGCFGGPDGPGIGWKDMTVLKLGVQWEMSERWTLRLGYSHANQQVPSGEVGLNIVTPAVVRQHLTAGMTVQMPRGRELSMSIAYALRETVSGQAPLAFGGHPIQLHNEQLEFEIGWAWITS